MYVLVCTHQDTYVAISHIVLARVLLLALREKRGFEFPN